MGKGNSGREVCVEILLPTEDPRFQIVWRAIREDGWRLSDGRILLPIQLEEIAKGQEDGLAPLNRVLSRARGLLGICQLGYELNLVDFPRLASGDQDPTRAKIKVVLVGDSAVGKTSLVMRYVLDQFGDTYLQTVGAKVTKKELIIPLADGSPFHVDMTIWDVMGSKSFVDLTEGTYFIGAQGILAVCDVTRRRSLKSLEGWIHGALHISGKVPVHILVNKVDLDDGRSLKRSDVRRFSSDFDASFAFASAKDGFNVDRAFVDLATRIVAERGGRIRS